MNERRSLQLLAEKYEQVLEQSEGSSANQGIIFRQNSAKDTGCCIGVKHGRKIHLSKDLIERINKIPNLKFYAEGSAGKNPQDEPGMLPFLQTNFPNANIESESWDDITENEGKGTANTKYNVIWTFMQHEFNKIIDWYTAKGTMLDAMARPIAKKNKDWPRGSPSSYEERLEWLTMHMKKAGFYDALNKPYDRDEFLKIMDQMEGSVYPKSRQFPKGQQFPDTSTYFGKMAKIVEDQRNQTIYDLMGEGGCCFAGSGHLIELKQQFPKLNTIDLDKI